MWTPETDGCDPDEPAALEGLGAPLYLGAPNPRPHPLVGRMERLTLEQIELKLDNDPPSRDEADQIAREEMAGRDRANVYRALALYIEPWRTL